MFCRLFFHQLCLLIVTIYIDYKIIKKKNIYNSNPRSLHFANFYHIILIPGIKELLNYVSKFVSESALKNLKKSFGV